MLPSFLVVLRRMRPERILLICATDALIVSGALDVNSLEEYESIKSAQFTYPDGTLGVAHAKSMGYGEVAVAAIYGTSDIDGTKWIVDTYGNPASLRKELHVSAYASGWFERMKGKHLQGFDKKDDIKSSISLQSRRSIVNFESQVLQCNRSYGVTGKVYY